MGNILRPHQDFLQNNAWLSQSQNSLRYQTSQLGSVVPMVIGTVRQAVNIVNLANYMGPGGGKKGKGVGPLPLGGSNTVAGKGGGGGKGSGKKGGGKKGNQDFTVDVDYILCLGPVSSLGQVFANASVANFGSLPLNFYGGVDGQAADPAFAALGFPVGYSGCCRVTGTPLDLGMSPVLPNVSVEIVGPQAGTAGPNFPADANPGNAITYFLTDPRDGAGWPPALLDNLIAGSGATYGDYCQAAQLVISVSLDGQQSAADWLDGIAKLTNSAIVWSGKLLRIIPYGDLPLAANGASWTPNLTPAYALTDDDFLSWHDRDGGEPPLGEDDPVLVTRTNLSDAKNLYTAQYPDRSNFYNNTIVEVFDQGAIDQFGERPGDSIPAKPFASAAPAQISAQLILQRSQYVRNAPHKFKIGWRYVRLEPMDIVLITDLVCGLDAQAVRVLSVEEDEEGGLTIEAEEITTGASLPAPAPVSLSIAFVKSGSVAGAASSVTIDPPTGLLPNTIFNTIVTAFIVNRSVDTGVFLQTPPVAVSRITDNLGLVWEKRFAFVASFADGSSADVEEWWADARSAPNNSVISATAHFAGAAYLPYIAVSNVTGNIDYSTVWDRNPSLPAQTLTSALQPSVPGISTNAPSSILLAYLVTTDPNGWILVVVSPYTPAWSTNFAGNLHWGLNGGDGYLNVTSSGTGLNNQRGARYTNYTAVPFANQPSDSPNFNDGAELFLVVDAIAGA